MCEKKRRNKSATNALMSKSVEKNKKRHEKRLRYSYKRVAATIKKNKRKTHRTEMCHRRIIELSLFYFYVVKLSKSDKKLCFLSGQHASCSQVYLTSYQTTSRQALADPQSK